MTRNTRPNEQQPRHRILHVTFNMGFGGTEQVIRQLVMHLPREQFTNEILCIDGEVGEIGQRLEAEQGITIHALKRQPGLDWRLAQSIRRLIRERGITIVHCHQYTPWFYGWLGSLGTGVRRVFTEHGRFHPDGHRRKAWLVNKLMAATTDAIVAISKATRHALIDYEYLPAPRITVIYNGIQPVQPDAAEVARARKTLFLQPDAMVIGTVARLDKVKNQHLILDTFAELKEKYTHLCLLIVGDGPERQALEATAEKLAILPAVRFVGFAKNPENYLAIMDIFLLPSFTEGTSMTLLEAMSLGIPCVASNVGGNPEIIMNDHTGLLFDISKRGDFIRSIDYLINNNELRYSFSSNAKSVYQTHFSAKVMANNYKNIYLSGVKSKASDN